MKRLFTLVYLLLFCLDGNSQVIFSEDFDGIGGPTAGGAGTYTFPSGWRLRNVDNRTPFSSVSYVNEAWERREDFGNSVIDSVMFSTSYYSPVGAADDWAWTPAITLTSNNVLSWNAKAYDPAYADGYEVRIMTMAAIPGGPTGGTGVMGNQVTGSTQVFSIASESSTWINRTLSLSAYAGQTVWIGFRNVSNDKFLLVLDDITVTVVNNYNAEVSTPQRYEYSMAPISVGPVYPLSAKVTNDGVQSLTGVSLTADVYNSSNNLVFTETSATVSLAPGANQTFTLSNFQPTYADDFTVYYHSAITGTDEVPSDDSVMVQFTVSDSIYARDQGGAIGSLGIGAGNGGYLGQQFTINTADTLTTISMYVTRGYTNKKYALAVWDMNGGYPNQIIALTDTLLYPDDSARLYVLPMHSLTVLNPGEYVVTAIEFDSTLAVGLSTDIFTLDKTWVDWPTNSVSPWGNNEDYGGGYNKAYMIRSNFADVCYNSYYTQNVTLCYGEQLEVGTSTYTSSGTYQDEIPQGYCDSVVTTNLVILDEIVTMVDATICFGESYSEGTNVYTSSGTYMDVLSNGTCDSTVITNLTVLDQVDIQTSISSDLTTFSCVPAPGVGYQWIDCNTGLPIGGANDNDYITNVLMTVAVIVTDGNCSDTSSCITNTGVGLSEQEIISFYVYPNPAEEELSVMSTVSGTFVLLNELGQELVNFEVVNGSELKLKVNKLASGVYFVKNMNTMETKKIILK